MIAQSSIPSLSFEYDDVGSVRVMLKGQRTVLLINSAFVDGKGPAEVEQRLLDMSPSDFVAWLQKHSGAGGEAVAVRCVHSVSDALFTPPGWAACEAKTALGGGGLAFSFRVPCVTSLFTKRLDAWLGDPSKKKAPEKSAKAASSDDKGSGASGASASSAQALAVATAESQELPARLSLLQGLRELMEHK